MHKQIRQIIMIPIVLVAWVTEQAHGGILSLVNTYPTIMSVQGIVSNTNNFIIIDPTYASTTGVVFSSSVTETNGTISKYLWNFPGGTPASSTSSSPGQVLFKNITYGVDDICTVALTHMVGSNTCTSITSPVTNVVNGITNITTITNWIYSINVEVPTFSFTNDSATVQSTAIAGSFYIKQGWSLQNDIIPVNSDVTIRVGGFPGLDMSSVDAIDTDDGDWTLNPGSGSTDQNGNFETTITSVSSTTLEDGKATVQVSIEPGSITIYSAPQLIYPVFFLSQFTATLYYCPKESGFTANQQTEPMPFSGRTTKTDFLNAVQQEGWGLMSQPINGHSYLGYYSGAYHLGDFPQDHLGNQLVPGSSAAGSRLGFDIDDQSDSIETYNSAIQQTCNSSYWNIVDVGSKVNTPTHVDLYYGVDNPRNNGLSYGTPATPPLADTTFTTAVSLTGQ